MKELAIHQHTAAALGNIPSLNGYREHTSRFSREKGERVHILLIIESQKHVTEVPEAAQGSPKPKAWASNVSSPQRCFTTIRRSVRDHGHPIICSCLKKNTFKPLLWLNLAVKYPLDPGWNMINGSPRFAMKTNDLEVYQTITGLPTSIHKKTHF